MTHFTLRELRALGAPPIVQGNIIRLLDFLEELRTLWGDRPVHITSGLRTLTQNELCGGSPRSQHLTGSAADLYVEGLPAREAWEMLCTSDIEVGQAIVYGVGPACEREGSFLHVSLPDHDRGLVNQYLWTPAAGGSKGPYHRRAQ